MRLRHAVAALVAVSSITAARSVSAQTIALTISFDGAVNINGPWNLGYSFIANTSTNVVSLGLWDQLGDGLINSHDVGLWDNSGTLLASATVGAGTSGILDNGFRFTDIAAVGLTAGNTYFVAATFIDGDDGWTSDPSTMLTDPRITYDSRRYEFGNALVFPDLAGSATTGYWGGNVRLQDANNVVATPEPASITLVASGLIGLFGVARRRRARTTV